MEIAWEVNTAGLKGEHLGGWAEARGFPRNVPPGDRDAFLTVLGSLSDSYKKALARMALSWVAECADAEHKASIEKAIERSEGGAEEFASKLILQMHKWLLGKAR